MLKFTFLICSERSGSNFITSLLNGHSAISGPSPTHLFRLFVSNIGNYGDLSNDDNWKILCEDVVLNFENKLGIWRTRVTPEALRQQARSRTVAELLRIIYEKEASFDKATHVVVKENHMYRLAPYLLAHFPACQFIFMVRDPRDVASSWVSTESIEGGVEKAVRTWIADQTGALSLSDQLQDTRRMLRIRYEDVTSNPEASLEGITRFLGVPYEADVLDFHRHPHTRLNAEAIHAWANLSKPVMRGNAGKFRDLLTPNDVRYVELRCFDLMKVFDYKPEQVTKKPEPSEFDRAIAFLQPFINAGTYIIRDENEQETRKRRLAALDGVLKRRL